MLQVSTTSQAQIMYGLRVSLLAKLFPQLLLKNKTVEAPGLELFFSVPVVYPVCFFDLETATIAHPVHMRGKLLCEKKKPYLSKLLCQAS